MADQGLSGDGAKGEAPEPEGSRTPRAGAAGERGESNWDPASLPSGSHPAIEGPLSGTGSHPQDLGPINAAAGAIRSHPGLQGLSDQEIDDLHAHLCAITGVIPAEERARQSAPAITASHNSGEGEPSVKPAYAGADTEVFPCDPRDPRPIWEQGLADSFTTTGGIDNLPIESAATSLWLVYSNEHRAWWGPGHHGYTTDTDRAGRYSQAAAAAICAKANIVPRDPPNEVMVLAPERAAIWSVGDLSDAELAEALIMNPVDDAEFGVKP